MPPFFDVLRAVTRNRDDTAEITIAIREWNTIRLAGMLTCLTFRNQTARAATATKKAKNPAKVDVMGI
jgi:hypothetical protein